MYGKCLLLPFTYIVTLSISTSVSSTTSEYLYKVHLMATADCDQDRWSPIQWLSESWTSRILGHSHTQTDASPTQKIENPDDHRRSLQIWQHMSTPSLAADGRCKPYISTYFSFKDIAACGSGLGVDVDAGSTVLVLALVKCCVLLGPIIDLWW